MSRSFGRAGRLVGGVAAAAVLLELGYLARTWYRYGAISPDRRPDPLLDRFMPSYEVAEHHGIRVAAPAEVTYAAARELDLQRSRVIRAIFRGRELMMGGTPPKQEPHQPFLQQVLALGWTVLAEEPGREVVLGAVTRPWMADVRFESVPPEEFATFAEPRYVKIAWTLEAEPLGPAESIFRTETRVATTDRYARERFRRYWAVFSPGILLIRRATLRLVKAEAEKRASRRQPGGPLKPGGVTTGAA